MTDTEQCISDFMNFLYGFRKEVMQEFKLLKYMVDRNHFYLQKFAEGFCKGGSTIKMHFEELLMEDNENNTKHNNHGTCEKEMLNENLSALVNEHPVFCISKVKLSSSDAMLPSGVEEQLPRESHLHSSSLSPVECFRRENTPALLNTNVDLLVKEERNMDCGNVTFNESLKRNLEEVDDSYNDPSLLFQHQQHCPSKTIAKDSTVSFASTSFSEPGILDSQIKENENILNSNAIETALEPMNEGTQSQPFDLEGHHRLSHTRLLSKNKEIKEWVGNKCIARNTVWSINKNMQKKPNFAKKLPLLSEPEKSIEDSSLMFESEKSDEICKCETCGILFTSKFSLRAHASEHKKSDKVVCRCCGNCFSSKALLINHMRSHVSMNQKSNFCCKFCGKLSNSKSNLLSHMRIHTGEKPFKCLACGKSFALKGTLQQHIKIHTGEKPYKCSACGKCFLSRFSFKRHSKLHAKQLSPLT